MDEHARLPTQTDAWNDAYVATWPAPVEIVEVDGARAVFLKRGPLRELVGRELAEPTDVLWRDRDAALALGRELAGVPAFYPRLLADSPLAGSLRAVTRAAPASPVVHLDESWLAGGTGPLSKRRASDLRRADRKAAEAGAVEIAIEAPDVNEVDAAIARMAAVEDKSWKGGAGTSLARDAARRRFFGAYGRRAAAEGCLRFAFLSIGGVDAAAQLAIEWRGAYWLFKIGFDEQFGKCSPGQLLMLHVIQSSAERGLERVEFLGAAAPWTEMWTSDERASVSLLALPRTVSGLAAGAVFGAGRLRKRFA